MGITFYQSMAFGTPVVTMPSSQMRSRLVYSGYKQMNIHNAPIANNYDEYISFCKKISLDKSYKEHLTKQINQKSIDLTSIK